MIFSFLVIFGIIVSLSFGFIEVSAQENNTQDFGISVETDEKLIENLTPNLPYLVIIVGGIIVGIFVIIKKSRRDDEEDSDDEFEDDSEDETSFTTKFQEIRTGTDPDEKDVLDPDQIIQNKIKMISKLQENKIGDNKKLELIKKTLIEDGLFTKEDNEYLEELLEEYEKNK